jgi:hypothetical protein
MSERIDALARRLREDPFFLAAPLDEYARGEQLDRIELAGVLACAPETLGPLGLCRRPRPESFWSDIERIAERFGIVPETLAAVIRRADALVALRGAAPKLSWLAAARDRPLDREQGP